MWCRSRSGRQDLSRFHVVDCHYSAVARGLERRSLRAKPPSTQNSGYAAPKKFGDVADTQIRRYFRQNLMVCACYLLHEVLATLCRCVMQLISCAGNGRCFVYVLFAAWFGQTWTHAASSCAICIISTEIIVVGFQQLQDTYAHLMYPRSRHKTTTPVREVWAVMLDEQSAPSNQTVTVTSNGNSSNFGVFADVVLVVVVIVLLDECSSAFI